MNKQLFFLCALAVAYGCKGSTQNDESIRNYYRERYDWNCAYESFNEDRQQFEQLSEEDQIILLERIREYYHDEMSLYEEAALLFPDDVGKQEKWVMNKLQMLRQDFTNCVIEVYARNSIPKKTVLLTDSRQVAIVNRIREAYWQCKATALKVGDLL